MWLATFLASERELVAEDPGALGAAGKDADELDGVDPLRFAADAGAEVAAGGTGEGERVRLAVAPGHSATMSATIRPSCSGVSSSGRSAARAMSMRCVQTSRVNPMSNR